MTSHASVQSYLANRVSSSLTQKFSFSTASSMIFRPELTDSRCNSFSSHIGGKFDAMLVISREHVRTCLACAASPGPSLQIINIRHVHLLLIIQPLLLLSRIEC